MNFIIIIVFSLILFLFQTLASALITYFLIVNDMDFSLAPILLGYFPSFIVSFVVFFLLAMRRLIKPYAHAFAVYLIVYFFGFVSEIIILQPVFEWPIVLTDLAFTSVAIFVATELAALKKDNID